MTRDRKKQSFNPPQFVRKVVFGMSQADFGEALGLRQGAVSKWEVLGTFTSVTAMKRIRWLAKKRKVNLVDTWLFEVPRLDWPKVTSAKDLVHVRRQASKKKARP